MSNILSSRTALKICFLLPIQFLPFAAYPSSGCERQIRLSQEVLNGALGGAPQSFEKLLRQLRCVDGGELEDTYIGIGEALFANPDRLGPYVRKSAELNAYDASSIASMLPARFVDQPCLQLIELKRRYRIVSQSKPFGKNQSRALSSIAQATSDSRSWCERQTTR